MCDQYPCEKYDGIDKYDSFITHRNQLDNLERANDIGLEAYQVELEEKIDILKYLLKNYNDGRKKSFFCISVNLLELEDIKSVIEQVELEIKENELTLKEKSKLIEIGFKNIASKHGIELKLNKKPKSKK